MKYSLKNISSKTFKKNKMGNLIIGSGSYVPQKIITNEDLLKYVSLDGIYNEERGGPYPEFVKRVMGFEERRWAEDDVVTSDLAYNAATRALKSAGLEARDLDLMSVTTANPDKKAPGTAHLLQKKLGVGGYSHAMDLHDACPGFVRSLHKGFTRVSMGPSKSFLNDGPLRSKVLKGAQLVDKAFTPDENAVLWLLRDARPLRGFLKTHPFVYYPENRRRHAALFCEAETAATLEDMESVLTSYSHFQGIAQWDLFVFCEPGGPSWVQQGAYTLPSGQIITVFPAEKRVAQG